jgi:hypothetical protein
MKIKSLIEEARIMQFNANEADENELEKAINTLLASDTEQNINWAIMILKTVMEDCRNAKRQKENRS